VNLAERFSSHPEQNPALVDGTTRMSYGRLEQELARWRGGLAAEGVGVGDRVALLGSTDLPFVLAYLAIVGVGAVAVPLNPQSPPAALARELDMVRPAAVVSAGPTGSPGADLSTDRPAATRVIDPGRLSSADPAPLATVAASAPAVMLFTSGTAGRSKPAVLTHGNLDAGTRSLLALPLDLVDAGHVVAATIPLFHIFGLNTVLNLGLAAGATIVLHHYRSPRHLAELVEAEQVTVLSGPPTMWRALAYAEEAGAEQFRSIKLAISGAAKLPPALHGEVVTRLGIELSEGYGLTETSAIVATGAGTDAPVGSVGRLLPGVEARLVDADGVDVLVGDPGEIWVRGPMVSPGYFGPDGTIGGVGNDEGWFQTGDVGVVDDDGNIAIVDRLSDLVIVSGFNVFPDEVETVLNSHPGVAGAAVTGEPDELTGERLVAHVVVNEGWEFDVDALVAHCGLALARYKVPKRFEARDHLPTGLGGKLKRRELG